MIAIPTKKPFFYHDEQGKHFSYITSVNQS